MAKYTKNNKQVNNKLGQLSLMQKVFLQISKINTKQDKKMEKETKQPKGI